MPRNPKETGSRSGELDPKNTVQSLAKGFRVLQAFTAAEPSLKLSEVARRWDASGLLPAQSNKRWYRGTVKDVLTNPRHAGLRRYRAAEAMHEDNARGDSWSGHQVMRSNAINGNRTRHVKASTCVPDPR